MTSLAKRILLVEDDEQVLFTLRASLPRLDIPFEIITANDGRDAFRLLQSTPLDLFVTAIRLPGVDGITLTQLVRSWLPQLPVIWITAHGCEPVRAQGEQLGIYRCLEKPVEVGVFRSAVQEALEQISADR